MIKPRVQSAAVAAGSILLIASFLVAASGYFNSKEIGALSAQCLENDGAILLELHNPLTSDYSFACETNKGK